jgi:hypothetical protein
VRLTNSQPIVGPLLRKYGTFDVSQTYRFPRPINKDSFIFRLPASSWFNGSKFLHCH